MILTPPSPPSWVGGGWGEGGGWGSGKSKPKREGCGWGGKYGGVGRGGWVGVGGGGTQKKNLLLAAFREVVLRISPLGLFRPLAPISVGTQTLFNMYLAHVRGPGKNEIEYKGV